MMIGGTVNRSGVKRTGIKGGNDFVIALRSGFVIGGIIVIIENGADKTGPVTSRNQLPPAIDNVMTKARDNPVEKRVEARRLSDDMRVIPAQEGHPIFDLRVSHNRNRPPHRRPERRWHMNLADLVAFCLDKDRTRRIEAAQNSMKV